jgi:poly(3-hydroxybutyrate) depolymerase
MNLAATPFSLRGSGRIVFCLASAALVATVALDPPTGRAGRPARPAAAHPISLTITYTTHDGAHRGAVVLLPAWYSPRRNPPLPLVISPHGRGATGRSNAKFWGNLPTVGGFAVISPDGMGRRLNNFSYGYRGQIDDLARMPQLLASSLPWVNIDRHRIFALGSSMGGQETLLLVARHPGLLAGAAAMDSVTNLALRYDQALELPTEAEFVERWGSSESTCLRSAMRREVGGTPDNAVRAYAVRSPLSLAAAIAKSGVPLQIWWSRRDKIVVHQETQSGALYRKLRALAPRAPIEAYIGRWAHSHEMRATALLPLALRRFGLLPSSHAATPAGVEHYGVA